MPINPMDLGQTKRAALVDAQWLHDPTALAGGSPMDMAKSILDSSRKTKDTDRNAGNNDGANQGGKSGGQDSGKTDAGANATTPSNPTSGGGSTNTGGAGGSRNEIPV
jgi:hypothetical protein